jgi:NAD(P)H-hydrate epimerase
VLRSLGVHGQVVILCGKGNNGGDGLVIARHLANAGIDVISLLLARPDDLSSDAAVQWNIVQRMQLPTQVWADQKLDDTKLAGILGAADWIVDALFGTGLTGPVRAPLDRVIALFNASSAHRLAVDIPTGLDADTGAALSATVRAEHTVTFVAEKMGFRNPSAAVFLGCVHVADIGVAYSFQKSGDTK